MSLRMVLLEVQDQQKGALKALAHRDTRSLRRQLSACALQARIAWKSTLYLDYQNCQKTST